MWLSVQACVLVMQKSLCEIVCLQKQQRQQKYFTCPRPWFSRREMVECHTKDRPSMMRCSSSSSSSHSVSVVTLPPSLPPLPSLAFLASCVCFASSSHFPRGCFSPSPNGEPRREGGSLGQLSYYSFFFPLRTPNIGEGTFVLLSPLSGDFPLLASVPFVFRDSPFICAKSLNPIPTLVHRRRHPLCQMSAVPPLSPFFTRQEQTERPSSSSSSSPHLKLERWKGKETEGTGKKGGRRVLSSWLQKKKPPLSPFSLFFELFCDWGVLKLLTQQKRTLFISHRKAPHHFLPTLAGISLFLLLPPKIHYNGGG